MVNGLRGLLEFPHHHLNFFYEHKLLLSPGIFVSPGLLTDTHTTEQHVH